MFKKLFVAAIVAIVSFTSYAQTAPKFGTVDLQAVMNDMPETSVYEKELSAKIEAADKELQKLGEEYQQKLQSYVEKRDSLDEITRQMREEELNGIQNRAQNYQQMNANQIQQFQQQQISLIREKLFKAVRAVGDREKFTAIFPASEEMYFSPTETKDVTAMVKAQLGIK